MAILIKRLIVFIVLLVAGYYFYRRYVKGEKSFFSWKRKKEARTGAEVQKMEKDPVCGTYVPEKTALKLRSGGDLYYFCSEKCRKEYISLIEKK